GAARRPSRRPTATPSAPPRTSPTPTPSPVSRPRPRRPSPASGSTTCSTTSATRTPTATSTASRRRTSPPSSTGWPTNGTPGPWSSARSAPCSTELHGTAAATNGAGSGGRPARRRRFGAGRPVPAAQQRQTVELGAGGAHGPHRERGGAAGARRLDIDEQQRVVVVAEGRPRRPLGDPGAALDGDGRQRRHRHRERLAAAAPGAEIGDAARRGPRSAGGDFGDGRLGSHRMGPFVAVVVSVDDEVDAVAVEQRRPAPHAGVGA